MAPTSAAGPVSGEHTPILMLSAARPSRAMENDETTAAEASAVRRVSFMNRIP